MMCMSNGMAGIFPRVHSEWKLVKTLMPVKLMLLVQDCNLKEFKPASTQTSQYTQKEQVKDRCLSK